MRQILLVVIFFMFSSTCFGLSRFDVIEKAIQEVETDIPKDLIRAIAWVESYWSQYDPEGDTFQHINDNGSSDWGVMQINDATLHEQWDLNKVQNSTKYNIFVGVKILEWKLKQAPRIRDKYKVEDKIDIQIAIKLYNGWIQSWEYLDKVERILEKKPWRNHLRSDEDVYNSREE